MTENNNDRYQQVYQEALKAYHQDMKSTVQRKACNLWSNVKEKGKKDKSSTIFKDTFSYLRKECLQSKANPARLWTSLKTRPTNLTNNEPPPISFATNVANDEIEVENDATTPGSSKKSCNKRGNEQETPAQNKLRAELGTINEELASYACIKEGTGLSDEYKKRVKELNSKKNEVEKKLKRKVQDVQSQHRLREEKKKAMEKLAQDYPDVSNVLDLSQVFLLSLFSGLCICKVNTV